MFIKRKPDKFAILLDGMAENLDRASDEFVKIDLKTEGEIEEFFNTIKVLETHGDSLMHELIGELNQTFITPIEREDILALANALDDVLDQMESVAAMYQMYTFTNRYNDYIEAFVKNIQESCREIKTTVHLVGRRDFKNVRVHSIKIKDLETRCDDILRQSIRDLFENETDPIVIIKMKDIYNDLEKIADYTQTVAGILESIVMKNS